MENTKEGTCESGCGCGQHSCGMGHHKHKMFKKIFMLVIILIAFCFGMQLGELKGELRAYHGGSSHMRSFGNYSNYPMPMMGFDGGNQSGSTWTTAPTPTIPLGAPVK